MPFYHGIKETTREGTRTLEGLFRLRKQLDGELPKRDLNDTLLLATWNIREFDSNSFVTRSMECMQYIAEIVSCFDLVAIQEVRSDLEALNRLRRILGSWWEYMVSDVTKGRRGNRERMAFLYDTRKVRFGRLAGELVLPPIKRDDGSYIPVTQVARTPFMCGFSCGWTNFIITTAHIIYGKSVADNPEREAEINHVAKFLKERSDDDSAWSENFILLGDFNIYDPPDQTMKAILNNGFEIPDQLMALPANASKSRHYDQIAFRTRSRFGFTGRAGVLDYYKSVYRIEDQERYIGKMGAAYHRTSKGSDRTDRGKKTYYRTYWRTHQMSDHLPMWVQLRVNFSREYLEEKLNRSGDQS